MTSDVPNAPYGRLPEGGTPRPITRWGTPVMHRRQADVTAYDESLREPRRGHGGDDARRRRRRPGGLPGRRGPARVRLRLPGRRAATAPWGWCATRSSRLPEGKDRKLDEAEEGCLSYPGAYVDCARPDSARVTGYGIDGEPVTFDGDGLLARCLQHETDHTLGTVFADRLSSKLQKKLRKAQEKVADDFPPDWPAESGVRPTPPGA